MPAWFLFFGFRALAGARALAKGTAWAGLSHPRTSGLGVAVTLFRVSLKSNKTKRGFLTPTQSRPRLGLVSGSRGPTQIHIRGLCHWAGEPAGHLGAESPSRRTARPASARKTSSPCPHWRRGHSQAHHVNAVSRHRRVPPFASSRRPLTHALSHLQWQEPPRFIDASATSRASSKEPPPSRGPTTRPLRASPRHP